MTVTRPMKRLNVSVGRSAITRRRNITMPPPDEARRLTDAELAKLERRVSRVYQEARDGLQKTVDDYFARFQERDEEMKALIGTVQNGRTWTESDYKQWRLNQIARGKRFEALRDKMAERYTSANETAMSYVNDKTPGIYSLNRNYSAYVIDKATGGALTLGPDGQTLNADFILYDEQTVRRLIVEEPDVMPYYPPERAVQRGIDLAYGKSQITKNVVSGILQGLSVKRMSDALQERVQTMERNSAIRAVRTSVTAAQNAGRMDSYRAAQDMGIKLKKRWLATLDGRTRHSHRRLDGETRETEEAFSNGCLYPGDPRGAPHETYNCRCTLIASLPDFDLSPGQRRARDPVTGDSVVIDYTTYPKWMESLKTQHGEKTVDIALKKAHNEIADREQHKVYKKLLGKEIPTSFQDFQRLKYEQPDKWEQIKGLRQYKKRVPEAQMADYEAYQKLSEMDLKGTVRVPPEPIDADSLEFKDEHGTRHGCTIEDARSYIKNAKCSILRTRWNGEHINYYSFEGAAYVEAESQKINTAFSSKDFDVATQKILEVFR